MKTTTKILFLFAFCFLSIQSVFSQEESRYEQTLNIEFNGIKSKVKLNYISYSLSQYQSNADPAAVQKPDPTYLNVTTSETPTKDFMKIFENFKQKVNGFIEIKDNFGKSPARKFEFKNAYLVLAESLSNVNSGNSSNISIYSDSIVIDGVSIFSK
jgi:Hemolysin coregulated protein Hcp (TssD)